METIQIIEEKIHSLINNINKLEHSIQELALTKAYLLNAHVHSSVNTITPVNDILYLQGNFVHPNTVLVHVGADTYIERTAYEAMHYIDLKIAQRTAQIQKVKEEIISNEQKVRYANEPAISSDAEIEICEEYDEMGNEIKSVIRPLEHREDLICAAKETANIPLKIESKHKSEKKMSLFMQQRAKK